MVCAMLPCGMANGSDASAALSCDYTVSSSNSSEGGSGCSSPLSGERTLLHRLYVVGIPDGCTETSLHSLFAEHGSVRDLAIMYDKANGQCSGYAFVSYATRQEADSAIAELDDRLTLPGSHTPMRVRYAKNAYGIPLGAGPADNTKLHFSRVPRGVSRDAVVGMFASFDTVVGIEIFRGKNGCSMGLTSGLVTLATHAGAAAARRALDGHVMEGGCAPLKVQWSDPDMQHKKRRAQQAAEGRTLFFSRALTTATKADIQTVFSQYGQVLEVVPFLVSKGSTFTRGCGLVMMGSQQEATAAIEGLNSKYTWAGKDRPMVVVPLDMTLQERRRNSTGTTAGMGFGQKLRADSLPFAAQLAMADALSSMDLDPALALQMQPSLLLRSALSTPPAPSLASFTSNLVADPPPVGCDRDAYKLFVGNVPKACTEEHLKPLFEPYGKVVELVVTRDKQTKASKGSAFVWYATKLQATTAAAALNKKPLDPSNPESASLVVRRANPRQVSLPVGQQGHAGRASRLSVDGSSMESGVNGLASSFGQLGLGGAGSAGAGSLAWLGGGLDMGQDLYAPQQQASGALSMDQAWALHAGQPPLSQPFSHNLRSLRTCPSAPASTLATAHSDGLLLGNQRPPLDFYSMLDGHGQHGNHAAGNGDAAGSAGNYGYLSGRTLSHPHDASMTWQPSSMASSLHPAASAPLPQDAAEGLTALSLQLNLSQVGEVARHIHGVQSLTGAHLTMSTGPMGDFSLLMTGQKERVLQARALMSSMLEQAGATNGAVAGSGAVAASSQPPLQQHWQQQGQLQGGFGAPEHLADMVQSA